MHFCSSKEILDSELRDVLIDLATKKLSCDALPNFLHNRPTIGADTVLDRLDWLASLLDWNGEAEVRAAPLPH